jgi:anti-sigma factor RsiW
MTCRGLIARLGELPRGGRAPEEIRESQRHLGRCGSCAAYRRSYLATVDLARAAFPAEGRAEMPEALVGEILAASRRMFSRSSPRARYLVHLLAGVAAGPLLAFYLR